jgi:hypothetical protein
MDEVQARISDGRVLALIDAYLQADISTGSNNGHRRGARRKAP